MAEIIDYEQGSSMSLGGGYDLIQHTVKSSPFRKPIKMITEGKGPSEYKLSFIESATHLSEFLDIGTEGVYDSLVFSVSGKAEFVRETSIDDYSLLFVVHVRCSNNVEILDQPVLSPAAVDLLKAGDLARFRESFGDYYLSALTRGGELFGMIRIDTHSYAEKQALKSQASAKGWGWSAQAEVKSFIESVAAKTSITMQVKINGLTGQKNPTSVAELFALAANFPALVEKQGTPLKVELRPINELPEVHMAVRTIDEETLQALVRLSDHYLDYTILANNIQYMLSSRGLGRFDFDAVSKDTIHAQEDKVKQKLGELRRLSDKLLRGELAPGDRTIRDFVPSYVFDDSLKLPNPIDPLNLEKISVYPLKRRTKGDAEMDGHRPRITISAQLAPTPNNDALTLKVHVKMKENKSDWTTFEDDWSGTVLDLKNTGLRIVDFRPKNGSLSAQAGEDDHSWHWYPGSELLKRAYCRSDVDGKETGKIGASEIEFNPARVVITTAEKPARPKRPMERVWTRHIALVGFWTGKRP